MKSSSKIGILVSIQIILILSSFLVLAYLETTKALHGNLVNVSGKNRFLASEIKNEINHIVFHVKTNDTFTTINLLEDNLLFLKDGGVRQDIELEPLSSKYDQDWKALWAQYVQLDRALDLVSSEVGSTSIEDVEKIERLADDLITDSDILTNKIGKELETLSSNLFIFEILLGSINIAVHVFMILYIISIFKKESEKKLKNERFTVIGELASNIAHDIKNPLTVISNSLQIIQKIFSSTSGTKEDLVNTEISRIGISVKRIDHQVDEVLNYVKNVPMRIDENSLLEILKNAKDTAMPPPHIHMELPIKDIEIECDETQLHVAFVNLFRNAIQAIDKDAGTIKVNISDLHENKVQIDFTNSGPAISEKELTHLFEPLFTTKLEGTGLGLTSCKNIITRHNGTIHVQTKPVIFTIILPKKYIPK